MNPLAYQDFRPCHDPIENVTSSRDLNWVCYLTAQMNSSLILTYNFATPNAFVNSTFVDVGNSWVRPGFERVYANATLLIDPNNVFAFCVRTNEYVHLVLLS